MPQYSWAVLGCLRSLETKLRLIGKKCRRFSIGSILEMAIITSGFFRRMKEFAALRFVIGRPQGMHFGR
jgi:hypothetical protein